MKTALYDAPGPEQPTAAPLEFPRARRSPRKVAFVRVWLRRETGDRIWEEETQTQMLSRHGAAIECRHAVQTGEVLAIIRRDNGKRVNARVAYSKYSPNGDREIGVELLDNENFWNVNWSSVEPAPPAAPAIAEPVATPAENTIDASKRAWATPERVAERRGGEWREAAVPNSSRAGEIEAAVTPESDWLKLKKRPGRGREDQMAEQVAAQEKRLWRAIREKDAATLRSLLAEDLLWVSPEGAGGNRLDFETYVRREWADRTPGECEFMRINKAAAIVAFLSTWTGAPGSAPQDATGAPRRASIVYHSSVWMRRGGRWWVVFHQVTPAE